VDLDLYAERGPVTRVRLGLAAGLALGCLSGPAGAVGLGIQPGRFELVLKPGDTQHLSFDAVNPGGQLPLRAHVYVTDVVPAADGSADLVPAGTTAWSASSWVELETVALVVPPQGRAPVLYAVHVPKSAQGSGYAAIVTETTVPPGAGNASVAKVVVRIPFLLHVRAAGTEVWQARIREFRPSSLSAGEPLRWLVTVENEGNVLIRPAGTLSLRAVGAPGRILPVNPNAQAVFPGQSKTFEVDDPRGVRRAGYVAAGLALQSGDALRLEASETFAFTP